MSRLQRHRAGGQKQFANVGAGREDEFFPLQRQLAATPGRELSGRLRICRIEPYPAMVRDKAKRKASYSPVAWRYALEQLAGDDSLRAVWFKVRMLTPFFRLRNRLVKFFARN